MRTQSKFIIFQERFYVLEWRFRCYQSVLIACSTLELVHVGEDRVTLVVWTVKSKEHGMMTVRILTGFAFPASHRDFSAETSMYPNGRR
jgi:hypothetical protein